MKDEHLNVPNEFEIIDFEGRLYSVATDIDQHTDVPAMDKEVDEFLDKSGFVRDKTRFKMGNIITSPLANEILSYSKLI